MSQTHKSDCQTAGNGGRAKKREGKIRVYKGGRERGKRGEESGEEKKWEEEISHL